ncbi:unnamed protein product [Protopolystoma xenopodis]|uniref:Uncharacterized protein n=1 Tax=Protopolystoma xenopodis TaxID=117903 RepID=A0A3S5ANS0_9PLAT|nr:unnamed protein product [Protopolystoma xenopodis]
MGDTGLYGGFGPPPVSLVPPMVDQSHSATTTTVSGADPTIAPPSSSSALCYQANPYVVAYAGYSNSYAASYAAYYTAMYQQYSYAPTHPYSPWASVLPSCIPAFAGLSTDSQENSTAVAAPAPPPATAAGTPEEIFEFAQHFFR